MPKAKKDSTSSNATAATVGYEAELWQMADALRGSMDAAEYKHVVLGLIFLKYISDAFEEQHAKLEAKRAQGADPEDPDEYRDAEHPIFWVPSEARWPHLKSAAKQPKMSSNQSGEGEIRKNLVETDLVDCMVALPGQLFYSTQIPACLWFLARDKKNSRFRDRCGHVLFLDARKLGRMVDRTHREFVDEDITRIANTYHAWRGEKDAGEYANVAGFCKNATLEEIRKHGPDIAPGEFVAERVQATGNAP